MRRWTTILILLLEFAYARGQQVPLFNASIINPILENPALSGVNAYSQTFLHYRQQWIDIEGAPESALLSVDWPLKDEKSGLGLILSSDKTNILGQTGIATSYSHGIELGADQYIRLGLSFKLNHNTIYFDKVKAEDQYESTLFNYFESATGLNSNFGVHYRYNNLQAGITALNMVNSKLEYSNNTEEKKLYFQYIPQYLVHVNYTYCLPNEICLRPELALRDLQGMPAQFEASILATFQGKYSASVLYRNNNSLGFVASALVYDRLTVAYSYQLSIGDLYGYSGSSHEITLGYRFYTSHFQDQKPADDEKLDQVIEFAQKQAEDNKQLQEKNRELQQKQSELNEELRKEKEEIAELLRKMEEERATVETARTEDEADINDISEDMLENQNEPIYLILGTFSDILSAKKYQQVLRREHQLGSEVLKRHNSGDYIVCINRKFDSKSELKREIIRLKKLTEIYNSSVWIYVND